MTIDPRRSREISIKWNGSNLIGRITVGGEYWAAVEWSEERQCWCIEDSEGRCLLHEASIHGAAASKDAAVALATEMIRDGRLPTPQEAKEKYWASLPERERADEERRRLAREKRNRQPAVQRRRAEAKQRGEELSRAWSAEWSAKRREGDEQPLYEMLHDIFDFADPDLWKSNSFAALRPRLIIHLKAVIAHLESEQAYERRQLGKARRRSWAEEKLAKIAPGLAKAREILELLRRQ